MDEVEKEDEDFNIISDDDLNKVLEMLTHK